jgi:hypothetical protein
MPYPLVQSAHTFVQRRPGDTTSAAGFRSDLYKIRFTMRIIFSLLILAGSFVSCKKNNDTPATEARLIFKFKFDSTQARLNNIGQPAAVAPGNAAQSPRFNSVSVHYIELAPEAFTPLGQGTILYRAPETTLGGSNAIDFDKSVIAKEGENAFTFSLKNLPAGTYKWLRVSFAYQNLEVKVWAQPLGSFVPATVAGFIGFNTYIKSFKIQDSTVAVNANKLQGFWAVESKASVGGIPFGFVTTGQAPPGATTVVNPIFATSPVPPGSCVVTGNFAQPLSIKPDAGANTVITVSLSTNKSVEWIDTNANGRLDPGEQVVDMGLRGLIPIVN